MIMLPTLTVDQCVFVEQPKIHEEMKEAIGSLKNGKSPGPDVLPGDLYEKFSETSSPTYTIPL